jgi:hypothetical protein
MLKIVDGVNEVNYSVIQSGFDLVCVGDKLTTRALRTKRLETNFHVTVTT